MNFIESELDKDYYYLQDWADVQMQLAPRAVRPMRDLEFSEESQAVIEEAENYQVKFNLDECTDVCVLASLVTPGVGFTFDQLKTLPLTPSDISAKMAGGANVEAPYMEGAELTKHTTILFTSNIGAQTIVEKFNSGIIHENNELMDIMQGFFRPEFLARLTEIVPFSPITDKIVVSIFDIHLKGLLKLLEEQNITLTLTPEARQAIALRGYNQQYGARPVLGVIRKELRHPISKMMIAGKVKPGDNIEVRLDKESQAVFVINGKAESVSEKPKKEKK